MVFAGLVVLAALVISFLPSEDKHALHTRGHYHSWGHLIVFGVVAFVVARASRTVMARILLFLGSIVFGFAIEYAEHVAFKGSIEWKDVVVDTLGVLLGTVLAVFTALVEPVEVED